VVPQEGIEERRKENGNGEQNFIDGRGKEDRGKVENAKPGND
jgi:hypothetical protein